jgi:hypothetical protein
MHILNAKVHTWFVKMVNVSAKLDSNCNFIPSRLRILKKFNLELFFSVRPL